MSKFKLVNPLILGNMNTEFIGNNSDAVATEAWNSISKHITGNVPRFGFSLKDTSNDKLHHYMVKEKISNNKIVDYSIEPLDIKMSNQQEAGFVNHINKLQTKIEKKSNQTGGKKKQRYLDDDEDDDFDDEDDEELYNKLTYYRSKKHPFYYWWYNPLIYTLYGTHYNSIYIPTFSIPFYPYIEVDVSSAFFA